MGERALKFPDWPCSWAVRNGNSVKRLLQFLGNGLAQGMKGLLERLIVMQEAVYLLRVVGKNAGTPSLHLLQSVLFGLYGLLLQRDIVVALDGFLHQPNQLARIQRLQGVEFRPAFTKTRLEVNPEEMKGKKEARLIQQERGAILAEWRKGTAPLLYPQSAAPCQQLLLHRAAGDCRGRGAAGASTGEV